MSITQTTKKHSQTEQEKKFSLTESQVSHIYHFLRNWGDIDADSTLDTMMIHALHDGIELSADDYIIVTKLKKLVSVLKESYSKTC